MNEDPKSKSWWNTLPGVLTAVAAVIAAVTALVSTLHQTGWIGAKAPTSLSTATGAAVAYTSTTPLGPTPDAPATADSIALPTQTTLTYGKLSYQILSARLAHPSPGTRLLRFTIRMTSNDQYEANFWDASFRLRLNGVL